MIGIARGAVCNLARGAVARRGLTTTKALRNTDVHPGFRTIKAKQEKFLTEDGRPVYIKGGPIDSILYALTMAACVGAVGWEAYFFYELAQK